MRPASLPEAISLLQSSGLADLQLASLKYLKNEAVGHKERKRELIRSGIVDLLATTLTTSTKSRGKRRFSETQSGHATTVERSAAWAEEDEVRLQAIQLVNSLANGGPAFIAPMLAGNIVQALAATLSPGVNHPKIVLATLRALVALSNKSQIHLSTNPRQHDSLGTVLSSRSGLNSLSQLLAQKSSSAMVQNQVTLVCQLLTTLSKESCHRRSLLAASGFIDLLAAHLAAYRIKQRGWIGVEMNYDTLPPAPLRQNLDCVLSALCTIIDESEYRLALLLHSPLLTPVFPFVAASLPLDPTAQSSSLYGLNDSSTYSASMDSSLPLVYSSHAHAENGFSKAFPALGTLQPSANFDFADSASSASEKSAGNGIESEFMPWLISLVKNEADSCRLAAAVFLQIAIQSGHVSTSRERLLAVVVVPLLVSMFENPLPKKKKTASNSSEWSIAEGALKTLARLIADNVELQKAAVDAGAITKLATLLKQTFDPIEPPVSEWVADGLQQDIEMLEMPASCKLGYEGQSVELDQCFRMRRSCLNLVGALSESQDEIRKKLTETGVISQIIDSLMPLNEDLVFAFLKNTSASRREKTKPASLGNQTSVLVSACYAARSLSRSVSLLRTSLIDAGIAKPIFALLKHPDIDVMVAATDVICNLIVEFSPMRKDLEDAGAIKILCEHAHSADSRIRLASLWALKHLVDKSPNEIKTACFEDLGSGWLIQIISGSSTPSETSQPTSLASFPTATDDEPMLDTEEGGTNLPPTSPTTHTDPNSIHIPALHPDHLTSMKTAEDAQTFRRARADNINIQAQGLDFLRNIISGTGAPDMIDALFADVGAQRIFDLILSKLPSPANTTTTFSPSPPPPEIVLSAVFVAVHIAAGAPRHRQQLIQQTPLMRALLPCLRHTDSRVRVAAVWVLNNLTWLDSASDASGVRARAVELRRLGFEDELREMRDDDVLDVRERVATGLEQMRTR